MYSLIEDVAQRFSGVLASFVRRAMHLLLDSQFVTSRSLPGRLVEVILGSGMGLPHSGDVTDLALIHRMEVWATRNLSPYDISVYLRFKDDILFIFKNSTLGGRFCAELKPERGTSRFKLN